MIGLGVQEMIVLAILAGGFIAFIIGIVFVVRIANGSRISELEAENRRLREQQDRR